MKVQNSYTRKGTAVCGGSILRIPGLAVIFLLTLAQPANADPLLLETGQVLGSPWLILGAGLVLEALILAAFIRRPFKEVLTVCLLVNAISGFIGFVGLVFLKLKGVPVLPPGPMVVAAILIEAPLIALILVRPPIKKIITGAVAANLATGLITLAALAPQPLKPPAPGVSQDLELARATLGIRDAVDKYYEQNGFYPSHLLGGSALDTDPDEIPENDPLLSSGILDSYPANPYAFSLRTRQFTPEFLLLGRLPVTRPVSLNRPMTAWEARWFPIMAQDSRFGDPDNLLLSANGLSEPSVRESLDITFYHMNGRDCVPGCFFYRSYDFNNDGLADDYVLGAFGWPTGRATVAIDLIDAATGELKLRLDRWGMVHSGNPDGRPEPVLALVVAGTHVN